MPCLAGSLMGVLYANGDVHPCEVLGNSCLGNIRDYDYDLVRLWQDTAARECRDKIAGKCFCTYECAMASSLLFNPKYLVRIAAKMLVS